MTGTKENNIIVKFNLVDLWTLFFYCHKMKIKIKLELLLKNNQEKTHTAITCSPHIYHMAIVFGQLIGICPVHFNIVFLLVGILSSGIFIQMVFFGANLNQIRSIILSYLSYATSKKTGAEDYTATLTPYRVYFKEKIIDDPIGIEYLRKNNHGYSNEG
ncbi:hypothetical protein ACJX0J_021124 [Zea mays]